AGRIPGAGPPDLWRHAVHLPASESSVARMERRPYVPICLRKRLTLDAVARVTRMGRAEPQSKEGESCGIIAKLLWLLIRRSHAMRWRLRKAVGGVKSGLLARSRTARRRQRSWYGSLPAAMGG